MITWMQRHNRYLVWTIWVATIAFIGAGFVGWGSYKYGSKSSAVGEAGDVEISNARLNITYRNLYDRYQALFKGKFDEAQARKMGLLKQAFDSLASQAQLLNLAQQYGIVVSEKELADYIAGMRGFQENGVFNHQVYNTYLQNRGMKSTTFEAMLSDELTIQKLLNLIEVPPVPLENETVASALSVEDKIGYTVLSPDPASVTLSDAEIKQAWERTRDTYMTPQMYQVALLWTETQSIPVTDKELQAYYDKNSFNYVDANGTQAPFEKVKATVEQDLKIQKGKKQALLDYIAVKKGKKSFAETKKLPLNDPLLPKALWKSMVENSVGTLLKPKAIGSRYVTVKIEKVIDPQPMTYAQAKEKVTESLKRDQSAANVEKKAQELLKTIDKASATTSGYIRLMNTETLPPLNRQESVEFFQKLFTSSEKKGIISLSKRMVVYTILDQRFAPVDQNLTQTVQQETEKIKKRVFEEALFKTLNEQFPVKAYAKGL